jgi:diaminopimelate epimerase
MSDNRRSLEESRHDSPVRLTKHHGLGNDFLVLADPSGIRPLTEALARDVCDRRRGIGADGLLYLGPGRAGAQVSMVLLNADGGRAEMSGNGIACLVQAAVQAGLVAPPVVTVATDAGRRSVTIAAADEPRSHTATVAMGAVALGEEDEPEWMADGVARAVRADVGNPHLVLLAADPGLVGDRGWVSALGRAAEAAVAGGINVELISPADDGGIVMDVWERGVGLSDACGTGATAAAAAAHRWGLAGREVPVRMHGGPVVIDLGPDEATLSTAVTYVGTVDYPYP